MMEYTSGCKEALEELFQRYKNRILNFALRILGNLADAEDVVSEVFYTITVKPHRYAPSGKFSTWLYTVAHNASISKIRSRKRVFFQWFKKDPDDPEYQQWDVPDAKPGVDAQLEDSDTSVHVRKAIESLPLEQKEALVLREYQDLSYHDISQAMGCSLDKVKVLIYRARERLKKELEPLVKEVQS